jgi:hypothetical protein
MTANLLFLNWSMVLSLSGKRIAEIIDQTRAVADKPKLAKSAGASKPSVTLIAGAHARVWRSFG